MMTAAQKATGTNAFKVGDKVHWHISTDDGRGGGDCTREDNHDEATTKEIYAWEKDVALS
jgi:hypothetical protein